MVIEKNEMHITKFILSFETEEPDIDLVKFQQSLPSDFKVYDQNDDIYISLKTSVEEDQNSTYLVERELYRHFFLTSVKIKAEMIKKVVQGALVQRWRVHGELPENIQPQNWNYELPLQLKLWSVAVDIFDDVRLKILLFFQIIEMGNPSYPDYTDHTIAPDPLTECKFLRHLVAHSGDVKGNQLKLYCQYLNIPEVMYDITDRNYQSILHRKVGLLEDQARQAIENKI